MALTDTKVRSAKTEAKEYSLVDGDGMFLLIHPNGSKYWRFRFRFGGKQHLMAFGVYPEKRHWLMLVKRGKRPGGLLLPVLIPVSISVQ